MDIQIPDNVVNPALYREAFKMALESYDRPSAYRSMYIVRKYKDLGGQYKDVKKKKGKKSPVSARQRTEIWRKEKWVQVKPYVAEGREVKCGVGEGGKACRPLKDIPEGDDNLTMDEIVKKWGKKKVLELTDKKIEDMDGRLDWRRGTFTPSGKRPRDKIKKEEK
jgi:hypothetical protein